MRLNNNWATTSDIAFFITYHDGLSYAAVLGLVIFGVLDSVVLPWFPRLDAVPVVQAGCSEYFRLEQVVCAKHVLFLNFITIYSFSFFIFHFSFFNFCFSLFPEY